MAKTNAVRLLDRLGINYELREYAVNPDDLSSETVAAKIDLPLAQVFKTLAVRGDRSGIFLAVIPADAELDFKALAHCSGDRSVEMLPLKDVQAATGYVRGGVTALACKKYYPVYIDELSQICDVISISAGMGGSANPTRAGRVHPRGQGPCRRHRQAEVSRLCPPRFFLDNMPRARAQHKFNQLIRCGLLNY